MTPNPSETPNSSREVEELMEMVQQNAEATYDESEVIKSALRSRLESLVAVKEAAVKARARLHHFDNGEDDETGAIINELDAALAASKGAEQ